MSNWVAIAFDFVRHRWDSRSGLAIALLSLLSALVMAFAGIDISEVRATEWMIIVSACGGMALLWWWTRLPRVPKGKMGFGVAIAFEHSDHAQQLRSDFILTLRDLIMESPLSQRFHFVEFGASTARRIVNPEDAGRLARRCKLGFFLYGRARLRQVPQGPVHVINLSGIVRHSPIEFGQSKQFGADFP